MTKQDRRIAAMRNNPKTVRPDDLDATLQGAGFVVKRQTGSHKIYSNGPYTLPVPQQKPHIDPVYVRQAIDLIDKVS